MNLRESNNAFREEYSKVLRESTLSKKDEIKELLRNTVKDCILRGDNKKGMESALQATLESQFPDNLWWEVTNCNIFMELLSGKSFTEVLDCIVDGIKPEFLEENPILGNDTDIGDDASLVIEETVTMDGDDLSEDELQDALKEWNEFSDDDVEDDYWHSQVYGGDSRYCNSCGSVKKYDEDGFSFCPECNRSDDNVGPVCESTRAVKSILQPLVVNGRVRAFRDDEKCPRGFSFKSGNGTSGEVRYNGTDYVYAVVDGELRVMTASDAGWNWSETIYKNSGKTNESKSTGSASGRTISRETLARLRNKR